MAATTFSMLIGSDELALLTAAGAVEELGRRHYSVRIASYRDTCWMQKHGGHAGWKVKIVSTKLSRMQGLRVCGVADTIEAALFAALGKVGKPVGRGRGK
jgi:hypothetical protein